MRSFSGASILRSLAVLVVLAILAGACGQGSTSGGSASEPPSGEEDSLVVYSGRNEELVGPIIERFEEENRIDVEVRYGDTAELAATILEEGENSPADVFFAQDAGALGAVAERGLLRELPENALGKVEERFRDPDGRWVGISGRARVVVYNTEALSEGGLPDSILGFTDPRWRGRIGWAPTNASFQAFVTALRVTEGEEVAREWLEGIQANQPRVYEDNLPIVEATASGEIEVGFTNHYYLFRLLEERGEGVPARNFYTKNGDPGALVNVAGIAILNTTQNAAEAEEFLNFMLSEEAQRYFADETFEYPLIGGIPINERLVPLSEIETPNIDLGALEDLEGTLDLLRETGVL
ncbi:MAG TPA: iron ABC transporter substrate-binding protein [Rubrobacteraceae bacterium]|nr:iron ABC transporter substrate-binding protein [Rubrobacteraceae bacterium]